MKFKFDRKIQFRYVLWINDTHLNFEKRFLSQLLIFSCEITFLHFKSDSHSGRATE